jgi:hypothetical protein
VRTPILFKQGTTSVYLRQAASLLTLIAWR